MKRFENICLPNPAEINNESFFPGILASTSIDVLLVRVLEHDDYDSFQLLFDELYSPLCTFCMRFVKLREVAEEVVSDVFYTIWKNRSRIKVSSPKSYLYAAVRNRAFDYLRSVNRNSCCELEYAAHVPAENHTMLDALEHQELETQMNQCIGMLPKQCKIIFELSRGEGMKYREIADELSISIKTVEAQMGRALKQLRKVREAVMQ